MAIACFRFVQREPAAAETAPGLPPPPRRRDVPPSTLVTSSSTPRCGSRAFARNAALELARAEARSDLLMSVFYIGNRLQLLQQFTPTAKVAAAVDRACSVLDPRVSCRGPRRRTVPGRRRHGSRPRAGTSDAAMAGAPRGRPGGRAGRAEAAMSNLDSVPSRWHGASRGASAATAPLRPLRPRSPAATSRRPQGHRLLLRGPRGPDQLEALYRSVVSEANRANLSIYAVDARGLLTSSGNEDAKRDLRKSMETVRRQTQSRGGRAVTREDVLAPRWRRCDHLERPGDASARCPTHGRAAHRQQQRRAGGPRRALADMAGYYEVTYDPRLAAFDARSAGQREGEAPGNHPADPRGLLRPAPGEGRGLPVGAAPPEGPALLALRRVTSSSTPTRTTSARRGRSVTRRAESRSQARLRGPGGTRQGPLLVSWPWCATPRGRCASTSARTRRSR